MDKLLLKKWSNFKHEAKQPEKILFEVEQKYIDKFYDAIQRAEDGRLNTFKEIFGEGTSENPKLRMIMPYGLDDMSKLTIILDNIRKSEYFRLNPTFDEVYQKLDGTQQRNINYSIWQRYPTWECEQVTIEVNKKPLGWREGDEIPKVQVDTANLYLTYAHRSVKFIDKIIEQKIPFFKLLQKYYKEEIEWWQGNKSKNISAAQVFFTNNFITTEDIAAQANESWVQSGSGIKPLPKGGEDVVMISRHPIDVLRMSNFKGIKSCHSPGAEYFSNCQQEVASGGAIIFLISKEEFLNRFPDSIIPQKGEIFPDKDRRVNVQRYQDPNKPMSFVDDQFAPKARLRLRRVHDTETDISYAVPDTRIYGEQIPSFKTQTFKYFGNIQKNKFVKDGVLTLPDSIDNLVRYGGEYQDGGDNTVASNFALLMRTAIFESDPSLLQNEKYKKFLNEFRYSQIRFGGGDPSEFEDEDRDFTDTVYGTCEAAIRSFERRMGRIYQTKSNFSLDISYDLEVTDVNEVGCVLRISFTVLFPKSTFNENIDYYIRNPTEIFTSNSLENTQFSGGESLTYPDIPLRDVYLTQRGDDVALIVDYVGLYNAIWDQDYDEVEYSQLQGTMDDFTTFVTKLGSDSSYVYSEFEQYLTEYELFKPINNNFYETKEFIEKTIDNLPADRNEFDISGSQRELFVHYEKQIITFDLIKPDWKPFLFLASIEKITNAFPTLFNEILETRINKIASELHKQQRLFPNMIDLSTKDALLENYYNVKWNTILSIDYDPIEPTSTKNTESINRFMLKVKYKIKISMEKNYDTDIVEATKGFIFGLIDNPKEFDEAAIQAFNQLSNKFGLHTQETSARSVVETKKQRFQRLMREYAIKRREGLV